jgi:plastocyanin
MKSVLVALAVVSLAACGGGGGGGGSQVTSPPPTGNTPPPPPSNSITVSNNNYSPANKSIAVGATVNWAWNTCTGDVYSGTTCTSHSVTFDDGSTSPTQDQGTYSRTFTAPGTYNYHCAIHGAAMSGSVTVQ